MNKLANLFLISLLLATRATGATITNSPIWDGTTKLQTLGVPNSTVYGQTFQSTENSVISWSFDGVIDKTQGITTTMRTGICLMSGNHCAGDPLYLSGQITTNGSGAFQTISGNPGVAIPILIGSTYMVFVTTALDQSGGSHGTGVGATTVDTIASGLAMFWNVGVSLDLIKSQDGTLPTNLNISDFAIHVNTSANGGGSGCTSNVGCGGGQDTPEPATWALALAGLAGFAFLRRK